MNEEVRMRVGHKILGAFLTVVLVFGLVAAYSIITFGNLAQGARNQALSDARESFKYAMAAHSNDLRGYVIHPDPSFLKGAGERAKLLDAAMAKVEAAAGGTPVAGQIRADLDEYRKLAAKAVELFTANRSGEAQGLLMGELRDVRKRLERASDALLELRDPTAAANAQGAAQQAAQAKWLVIGLSAAATLLAMVVGLITINKMLRPTLGATQAATRLADGDLSGKPLPETSSDEFGEMARAFNRMQAALRGLMGEVSGAARVTAQAAGSLTEHTGQVAQTARGIASAVQQVAGGAAAQAESATGATEVVGQLRQAIGQIAAGAQEQATGVQQAADVVTEMVKAAADVATKADLATAASEEALATARNGAGVVERSLAGMDLIRQSVGQSARQIQELNTLSAQIGEMSTAITAIAGQTNMLALNAAIEAARAGEHGRGFAVVADSVRSLAEQAAATAREIGARIESIQAGTTQAVVAMERGTVAVEEGVHLAGDAGRALQEIMGQVDRTVREMAAIRQATADLTGAAGRVAAVTETVAAVTEENTASTEEMAAGADQVDGLVTGIADVAAQNAAATEEVAASVEEMNQVLERVAASTRGLAETAGGLQAQVARFKL